MNDLMLDLETLGRTPDSPIIAIGAVFFDKMTGETGAEFEVAVDFASACHGRHIDPKTVAWWMQQGDSARASVLRGNSSMQFALQSLSDFIFINAKGECSPWGNGATFDISMIEHCYRQYGMSIPWPFWAVRDCRTVEYLSKLDKKTFKREGVHHSALDDAKHQVKYISAMIRTMGQ